MSAAHEGTILAKAKSACFCAISLLRDNLKGLLC